MPSRNVVKFSVVPPSRGLPKDKPLERFVLQQDNWNDFSFQTQYQLYAQHGSDPHELVGSVKILKRGQTKADGLQLTTGFTKLDDSFASLGQSLDYYQRIRDLPQNTRQALMVALRDVVNTPSLVEDYSAEPGWETSVLRDFKDDKNYRMLARSILTGSFSQLVEVDQSITIQPPGASGALTLRFSSAVQSPFGLSSFSSSIDSILPARINVLIGRNASGKSTFLARLARIAFAGERDRDSAELTQLGSISPTGIGFPRVITISYSAFDSFRIPGINDQERAQIARDMEKGGGRFVFCGLRDIVAEYRDSSANLDPSDLGGTDRTRKTLLKSIDQLANEFAATIGRIHADGRSGTLRVAVSKLAEEASFNDLRSSLSGGISADGADASFLSWSTGHKIALQIVASLVAYTDPRSLVLFDEPEVHLHPPLLAALMHVVRDILAEREAFALIATHSPVVLQETPMQYVHVIRREGDLTSFVAPEIETFGESVGTLTDVVFGLTSASTDFQGVLRQLVDSFSNLQAIEDHFQPFGLSMQARAYVMSLLAKKNGAN